MSVLVTSSMISEISLGTGEEAAIMPPAGPLEPAAEYLGLNAPSYHLTQGSQNKTTRNSCTDRVTGNVTYRYTLSRSGCIQSEVCQLSLTLAAVESLKSECGKWRADAHDNELKTLCSSVSGVSVLKNQGQRVRSNPAIIVGSPNQFHVRASPARSDNFLDFMLYRQSKRIYRVTVSATILDDMKVFLDRKNSQWSIQKFEYLFFRDLHVSVPPIACRSPELLFADKYNKLNQSLDKSVKWIIGVTLAVQLVLKDLKPVQVIKLINPGWKSIEAELVDQRYPAFIVAFLKYYFVAKTKSPTLCTKVFGLFWAANFNLENVLAIAKLATGESMTLQTIATRKYCESGEYPRFNFSLSKKESLEMTKMFKIMASDLKTVAPREFSQFEEIVIDFQTEHLVDPEGVYLMQGKLKVLSGRLQPRLTSQVSMFDNNKKSEMLMALEPHNILKFVQSVDDTDQLRGAAFTILTHVWPLRANSVASLPDWCLLSVFNLALKHPSALYPMMYINTKLQAKSSHLTEFIVVGTIDHTSLRVLMLCFSKIMSGTQRKYSAANFFRSGHTRRTITKRFMQALLGSMTPTQICRLVDFNKAARALFTSENCKRVIKEALSKSDSKKQKKDGGASEEHSLGVARSNYTSWSIKTQEAVRKRILECREIFESVKKCPDYIKYTGLLDVDQQANRCRDLFNKMFGEDLGNAALCNWPEDMKVKVSDGRLD
jgi:hypothetical protein